MEPRLANEVAPSSPSDATSQSAVTRDTPQRQSGAIAADFAAGYGAAVFAVGILSPLLYRPAVAAVLASAAPRDIVPYKGIADVMRRYVFQREVLGKLWQRSAVHARGQAPRHGIIFALKDALRGKGNGDQTPSPNAPASSETVTPGLFVALFGRNVAAGAASAALTEAVRFPIARVRLETKRRAVANETAAASVPVMDTGAVAKHSGRESALREMWARGGLLGMYRNEQGHAAYFRACCARIAAQRGVQFGIYDTAKDVDLVSGLLSSCTVAIVASACGELAAAPWNRHVLAEAFGREDKSVVAWFSRNMAGKGVSDLWRVGIRSARVLEGALMLTAYDGLQGLIASVKSTK